MLSIMLSFNLSHRITMDRNNFAYNVMPTWPQLLPTVGAISNYLHMITEQLYNTFSLVNVIIYSV